MSQTALGTRLELARYAAAGEERALYGQRIDGIVRVTDCPIAGKGRRYLVERGSPAKPNSTHSSPTTWRKPTDKARRRPRSGGSSNQT